MSPQANLVDIPPVRRVARGGERTWDPPAVFAGPERKKKPVDRTSICVQITLFLVVTALLFSVIAAPKLRTSATKLRAGGTSQGPTSGR